MVQHTIDSIRGIELDGLADKVGGRHRLTFLVGRRMRDITNGAPLLVSEIENEALIASVCREITEGKIWLEVAEEVAVEIESTEEDILGFDDDDDDL